MHVSKKDHEICNHTGKNNMHFIMKTLPLTASRDSSMVTRTGCGDRVSVVMTVPHRVDLI